jgi:BirA family biotin operon repressor/biotin-[acetyl-CoA-carboxylase] ligase
LDAAALTPRLPPGWQLRAVSETGSTNADLLALAGTGEPDRSALVAELQVQGRGRMDRAWQSPAGAGLTVSVLVRPAPPVATWGWLPLLAGVALVRVLGDSARLKWPNDVLMGEGHAKVAGILTQTSGTAAVIGMGLNVSNTADELPVPTASSLMLQGFSDLDRGELLLRLLAALDSELSRWQRFDGDAAACGLAEEYRARSATIGRQVSVQLPDRSEHGTALAVDDSGRLVLRPEGADATIAVAAGDVTHVLPGIR